MISPVQKLEKFFHNRRTAQVKIKASITKKSGDIFCCPKNSTSTTKYEYKSINSTAQKRNCQGHAILTFLLT